MSAPLPVARRVAMGAAGAATLALLAVAGWLGYRAIVEQPVSRVVFSGEVERLPRADLEALSQAVRSAPVVSLESVREAARRIPWVRDATVRRYFPDTLEITFEAHRAFARWNDGQLLSVRGEVFTAEAPEDLALLLGPEGAGPVMLRQAEALVPLLAPLGSPLAELRLSPRGAWQVLLASGLLLDLGRGEVKPRLERFVAAWPQVADRAGASKHADLRYPNGFAMARTRPAPPEGTRK